MTSLMLSPSSRVITEKVKQEEESIIQSLYFCYECLKQYNKLLNCLVKFHIFFHLEYKVKSNLLFSVSFNLTLLDFLKQDLLLAEVRIAMA